MCVLQQSYPVSPANTLRSSVRQDLFVVGIVTLLTFVLSSVFELNEKLVSLAHPLEAYQVDELPVTVLAMVLALAWFSWRRSKQAIEQTSLRMVAQQALVDSEEQYRLLFTENLSGNLLASTDGTVRLANPAAAQLFGYGSADELNGLQIGEFYSDRELWEAHRHRLLHGEKIQLPILQLRRRDAVAVQAMAKMCARLSPTHEPELHVYITDITEVTLMQGELAGALEENRRLSQRLMQVQEEERRNLARELHDELGQSLNAIKVDAVAVRDHGQAVPEIRQSAQAIIEVLTQVYDVVRSLMQRLRPVALDELGLRSAVQYCVEQWRRRQPGASCTFVAEGQLDDLGEDVNITLYRLVQECLTNVTKHAGANRVAISLTGGTDETRFSFEDDGKGFDVACRSQGLGLIGLRERVEALAGRFELDSSPGQGARVRAVIPKAKQT